MTFIKSFIDNHSWIAAYHASNDGEGDDLQAVAILAGSIQEQDIIVNCSIGNPDIQHAAEKSKEMDARVQLTNVIFGRSVASAGAKTTTEVSEGYVSRILSRSYEKNLVLHIDSFKSLHSLFERSKPNQLKDTVILAYGSVNMSWVMSTQQDYVRFYNSLKESGAKLFQIEAFPFLGTRNKITHKNTPITYSLLEYLDGPAGIKWKAVNSNAAEKICHKQVCRIVDYLKNALESASKEEKQQINLIFSKIIALFDEEEREIVTFLENRESLIKILNQSVFGERHDLLEENLQQMKEVLCSILNAEKDNLSRVFNIYAGTTLRGQGLISDQIPAIIFSEFAENRSGIAKECVPVKFEALNGKFAQYALSDVETSLYYLDTKKKLEQLSLSKDQEPKLIDSYLFYIDLCIASAVLVNNHMITKETRDKLLSSTFGNELAKLAKNVQDRGYDLPKCYYKLIS